MLEFQSQGDSVEIRGRGWGIGVHNPGGYPDPGVLAGQEVLLDGKLVTVKGVEKFAIALPYPDSLPFGFLLDHPHRAEGSSDGQSLTTVAVPAPRPNAEAIGPDIYLSSPD